MEVLLPMRSLVKQSYFVNNVTTGLWRATSPLRGDRVHEQPTTDKLHEPRHNPGNIDENQQVTKSLDRVGRSRC